MVIIIISDAYEVWSFSLGPIQFSYSPVFVLSVSHSRIFLGPQFADLMWSWLKVREQVSDSYKTTGKLELFTFKFVVCYILRQNTGGQILNWTWICIECVRQRKFVSVITTYNWKLCSCATHSASFRSHICRWCKYMRNDFTCLSCGDRQVALCKSIWGGGGVDDVICSVCSRWTRKLLIHEFKRRWTECAYS
jgi:hypothetical protein